MSSPDHNLSTEHQPKGSARNPSDTLDREQTAPDTAAQNASVRRGGEAQGGIEAQPADPTSPRDADARAAERDREQAAEGFGDDGAGSTYRS